jgi:CBS domain containing-hemolysin-like protein
VNEVCGLALPEGKSVTLNGYLCDEFGEIPAPGRTIVRNNAHFTVVESKRGRIVSCRIKRIHAEVSEDETGIAIAKTGFETVAGYVLHQSGRIPRKGETYRLSHIKFHKARGRRLYCNTPTTDNAVKFNM